MSSKKSVGGSTSKLAWIYDWYVICFLLPLLTLTDTYWHSIDIAHIGKVFLELKVFFVPTCNRRWVQYISGTLVMRVFIAACCDCLCIQGSVKLSVGLYVYQCEVVPGSWIFIHLYKVIFNFFSLDKMLSLPPRGKPSGYFTFKNQLRKKNLLYSVNVEQYLIAKK